MASSGDDYMAGLRMREYRKRFRLTQDEVAEELARLAWQEHGEHAGVDGNMVSKWERGEKRPSKRYRDLLCRLFGATPEELGLRPTLGTRNHTDEPWQHGTSDDTTLAEDDVKRGEFLRYGAVLGTAVLLPFDITKPSGSSRPGADLQVAAVRDALMQYGAAEDGSGDPVTSLRVIHQRVARAWEAFQVSRYSFLAKELPWLLSTTQRAARDLEDGDRSDALRLESMSYQLAAIMLLKLGDPSFGWIAADRGMVIANASQDPLVIGSGARILSYAFSDSGHRAQAREIALDAASRLDDGLSQADPARVSLYGALLQKASIAAAFGGDRLTSRALLAEAQSAARLLGSDANHYWTAFGPTNVAVHRVSAAIVLGDGGTAVEYARKVHPDRLPVVERRAWHLLDVAHGHHQSGKDREALETVLDAERLAPEEVRYAPAIPNLVANLLSRGKTGRKAELRALAGRVGAPI